MSVPRIAELRQIVHKSEATYGPIPLISQKFIHPHVSIYLTRLLLLAGLTTNQATFVMMIAALVGASFFFLGGRVGFVGGSLLMLLSWILDHSDGEVRRFRGGSSSLGIYMDRFTHRVTYPLMHIGTGFALWRESSDPRFFVFGCAVAYFYQLGVAHQLDKTLINSERGDVDLGPLRSARLALTARYPVLKWPLKLAIGGYSQFIQHITFFVLMILSTLTGWVKVFYLFYGAILILNWVLNVVLDFTLAFRPSDSSGRGTAESATEIQMH